MTTDSAHADPIAPVHASTLREALDDETGASVRQFRPAVARALDADAPERRARGATTACLLSAVAPGVAEALTDPLVAVATDREAQSDRARRKAAHALVRLARAVPGTVARHARALVVLVRDDDPRVAGTAAGLCAALADHCPDAVASVRTDLEAMLAPPDRTTTIEAARAFESLATVDPGAASVAVDRLVEHLAAGDPDVAAAAARALVPLVEADPSTVEHPWLVATRLEALGDEQPARLGDGHLTDAIRILRAESRTG